MTQIVASEVDWWAVRKQMNVSGQNVARFRYIDEKYANVQVRITETGERRENRKIIRDRCSTFVRQFPNRRNELGVIAGATVPPYGNQW